MSDDDYVHHPDFTHKVHRMYALGHDVSKPSPEYTNKLPLFLVVVAIPLLPVALAGAPVVYAGGALLRAFVRGERPGIVASYYAALLTLLTYVTGILVLALLQAVAPGARFLVAAWWAHALLVLLCALQLRKRIELLQGGVGRLLFGFALAFMVLLVSVGACVVVVATLFGYQDSLGSVLQQLG